MKKIIAIVTLIATMSAFAGTTTKYGSLKVKGSSESEIVANAEALIPSILDGSNRAVRMDMINERCRVIARNMILGSLSIAKTYVSDDNTTFEATYHGSLRFGVKNCREER